MRLSASELAAAIGHPKASYSRAKLWRYKTGKDETLLEPNAYVQQMLDHGQQMEPVALAWFRSVARPHARVEKTGIWLLEDDPRIGASPDAVVNEPDGRQVPLEIKCPFQADWVLTPAREEKDTIQLLAQMATMRAPFGYLLYYTGGHQELIFVRWSEERWRRIYGRAWVFLDYVEHYKEEPPRLSKYRKQEEWNHYLAHCDGGSTYPARA